MGMLQPEHTSRIQGYIGMICLDDKVKQTGLGKHMAELVIAEFTKLDADVIVLETEDDNWRAIRFYEKLNFYKSRHYHRYYLNGKGAYQMTRWLKECTAEVSDE